MAGCEVLRPLQPSGAIGAGLRGVGGDGIVLTLTPALTDYNRLGIEGQAMHHHPRDISMFHFSNQEESHFSEPYLFRTKMTRNCEFTVPESLTLQNPAFQEFLL